MAYLKWVIMQSLSEMELGPPPDRMIGWVPMLLELTMIALVCASLVMTTGPQ